MTADQWKVIFASKGITPERFAELTRHPDPPVMEPPPEPAGGWDSWRDRRAGKSGQRVHDSRRATRGRR